MSARSLPLLGLLVLALAMPTGATAGKSIVVANASIKIGAYNSLELGWTSDGGTTRHVLVDNDGTTAAPDSLSKPVTISVSGFDRSSFQIYFRDISCNRTYLDDGTPVDHVTAMLVDTRTKGRAVTDYYFLDAGWSLQGCANGPYALTPSGIDYNAKATVLR